VTNANSGSVSVINTATNTVIKTIVLPTGSGPVRIAITPNGDKAYVSDDVSDSVWVIDTATNMITPTSPIPFASGTGPSGVAVTPDGLKVYVALYYSNDAVAVIDTATDMVSDTITGVGPLPDGVAITPNGAKAYVTNRGVNTVSVIDTATNMLTRRITVGNGPTGVAITPDGAIAYVANYDPSSSNISVIDTATDMVVGSPIPVGVRPNGLVISPDGARLYVTNVTSDSVSVIDTATNMVTTTIPSVTKAAGIAITPDGARVFVANNGDPSNVCYSSSVCSVSVIDTATNTVAGTIPVGTGPLDVAIASIQGGCCGDGVVFIGVEQCDDGNTNNNDACKNDCTGNVCGDGAVFIGVEQCDDGNASNNDGCKNDCTFNICGDGFVNVGVEQCDDANGIVGDGCCACRNEPLMPLDVSGTWQVNGDCGTGITATLQSILTENSATGEVAVVNPIDPMTLQPDCGTLFFANAIHEVATCSVTPSTAQVCGSEFALPHAGFSLQDFVLEPPFTSAFGVCTAGLKGFDNVEIRQVGAVSVDGSGRAVRIDGTSTLGLNTFIDINDQTCSAFNGGICTFTMLRNDVQPPSMPTEPVTVEPLDNATVTFDQVTSAGTASITPLTEPDGVVPANFQIAGPPIFYDVKTTAGVSGGITVCLPYPDADNDGVVDGTGINEVDLKILHNEGGVFVDRTVAGSLDTVNNHICALVTSLSQFVLAMQLPPAQCGNGILETGEQCDDGNVNGNDGCAANCRYELIPGNGVGAATTNARACLLEFSVVNPNNVPRLDRNGRLNSTQTCRDNDPTCDFDPTSHTCEFHVAVCVNNLDPQLSSCSPQGVRAGLDVRFGGIDIVLPIMSRDPTNYTSLYQALQQFRDPNTGDPLSLPIDSNRTSVCTDEFAIRVPLRTVGTHQFLRRVLLRTITRAQDTSPIPVMIDLDGLTLVCKP
jgi:YVTN family beta-propeller protein/cysteine-rich repeat protein